MLRIGTTNPEETFNKLVDPCFSTWNFAAFFFKELMLNQHIFGVQGMNIDMLAKQNDGEEIIIDAQVDIFTGGYMSLKHEIKETLVISRHGTDEILIEIDSDKINELDSLGWVFKLRLANK